MTTEKRRPNVLFILADQFRADTMSCAGSVAKTPNLDLIANEGVRFSQCATPAPLCIPARIALFTGKFAHTTGAWDNTGYILSEHANTWSRTLHDLGYNSGLFGKTHLHGSGDLIKKEPLVHSYGFDTVNEITGPHASASDKHFSYMVNEWREKGLFEAFRDDLKCRGKTPKAYPSPLPLEDYYDVYVGEKGNEYLENYTGDKPWFCHVSFGGPHEPWDTPEPYANLYKKEDMPSPIPPMKSMNADRPTGRTDMLMAKEKIHCSPKQAAEIRADYCGAVTLIDEMIGRIFETIKKRGEWDNTIIVFTSDHGEMNGDHGFVNKRTFLNGALNVPLIIRTPETAKQGGRVCDTLVSMIDAGPTMLELAGGTIEYEQCAKSLCPILRGETDKVRDYVLSELSGEIMYMDNEWKATVNASGDIYMLFNRQQDPDEQINLAGYDKETEAIIRERLLRALMENQCLTPSVTQQHSFKG